MTHIQGTDLKGIGPELRPGVRRRANRFARTAVTWFLAAFLLAACAGVPDLDEQAARNFQARVAAAKQLAAQENFGSAVAELEQLDREVQAAAEQGRLSQERQSRIETSMDKVRTDLQAAMAAAEPQPTPTATATEPPREHDGKGDGEYGKGEGEHGKEKGKDENKGKGKGD